MLSEKQLIANRNNCLKSTGPRTFEGKRIASQNAVRHGLLSDSAEVLLKGENQDEFNAFHQNLLINLDPQGQLEVLLAERITGFFWKLKRAGRMEKGLLDILCNPSADPDSSARKNSLPFTMITTKTYQTPSDDPEYQDFKKLKQQQALACGLELSEDKLVDRETFQSSQGLPKMGKESSPIADNSSAESLGKAVQHDFKSGSLLERLLRYEGQIERSLYRALTELQKFQFLRRRNDAIDVEAQNTKKPNEAIDADNVSESDVAQPPSAVINVGEASPLRSLSDPETKKPNEAIFEIQAPNVPVASKRSEDGSEGIEALHNVPNIIPNQPSSSEQRNQSTQANSGNIQSATCPQGIDNLSHRDLQSTEPVVPELSSAELPNKAIL